MFLHIPSSLKVEGFGDTEEKQITFYAVDRKENIGEPITYNIIPLTPSYIEAYNTLETNETFGGIAISMQNPSASDLAIEVITPDSLNQWTTVQTNYTAAKNINITARGYKPEERKIWSNCQRQMGQCNRYRIHYSNTMGRV